jgi:hypothetical protein
MRRSTASQKIDVISTRTDNFPDVQKYGRTRTFILGLSTDEDDEDYNDF